MERTGRQYSGIIKGHRGPPFTATLDGSNRVAPAVTHNGARWNNADVDRIELVQPDSSWPAQFELEARALLAILPPVSGLRVEHFGSTAIPGMYAKPIIDILVIHPAPDCWRSLIDPVTSLGYIYWAENSRRDRMFFVKGMPPYGSRRSHHVHVRVPSDANNELRFRDMLRASPALIQKYAELKNAFAQRYPDDRDAYTDAKTEFIAEVLDGPGHRE